MNGTSLLGFLGLFHFSYPFLVLIYQKYCILIVSSNLIAKENLSDPYVQPYTVWGSLYSLEIPFSNSSCQMLKHNLENRIMNLKKPLPFAADKKEIQCRAKFHASICLTVQSYACQCLQVSTIQFSRIYSQISVHLIRTFNYFAGL